MLPNGAGRPKEREPLNIRQKFRSASDAYLLGKNRKRKQRQMKVLGGGTYGGLLGSDEDDQEMNITYYQDKRSMKFVLPEIGGAGDGGRDGGSKKTEVVVKKKNHGMKMSEIRKKAEKLGYRKEILDLRQKERQFYDDFKGRKGKKLGGKKLLEKLTHQVIEKASHRPVSFATIAKNAILDSAHEFDDDSVLSYPETDSVVTMDGVGSIGSLGSQASIVTQMSACHMSTSLIMARAMDRFEKRKQVNQLKKFQTMHARAMLMNKIEEKKNRPKKLRRERRFKKGQETWLTIATLIKNKTTWEANFRDLVEKRKRQTEMDEASRYLQKTLSSLKSKKLWAKYTRFYAHVVRSRWIFMMAIRCWRRRKSADKMKIFLLEQKQQSQISIMVSKFLKKIRKLQRFMRHFIQCHRARMEILIDVWNEVESKFEKRLSVRLKEARKMNPISIAKTSFVNKNTLREYNQTVSAWQKRDDEMAALLEKSKEKKHISKGQSSLSMDVKSLSPETRNKVLGRILRDSRRKHVREIDVMMKKIEVERKKRAKCRYSTKDVEKVLNLADMTAGLKKPDEIERHSSDHLSPLFLFWSVFGNRSGLIKTVEKEYNSTYIEVFGDPIKEWKRRMKENFKKEEERLSNGSPTGAVRRTSKRGGRERDLSSGRRYAVSIETNYDKFRQSLPSIGLQEGELGGGGGAKRDTEAGVGAGENTKLGSPTNRRYTRSSNDKDVVFSVLREQMRSKQTDYDRAVADVKKNRREEAVTKTE